VPFLRKGAEIPPKPSWGFFRFDMKAAESVHPLGETLFEKVDLISKKI
jgi:hypothetical protein